MYSDLVIEVYSFTFDQIKHLKLEGARAGLRTVVPNERMNVNVKTSLLCMVCPVSVRIPSFVSLSRPYRLRAERLDLPLLHPVPDSDEGDHVHVFHTM